MEPIRSWSREFGKGINYYRRSAIKKAKYKINDKILIYLESRKTLKSCKIKNICAALVKGCVVEFDLYYFGIDKKGSKISFIPEHFIKRKI